VGHINISYSFQQLRSGHACITLFKALSVLDFENEFEIFCFYAQKCKAVSNKPAGTGERDG